MTKEQACASLPSIHIMNEGELAAYLHLNRNTVRQMRLCNDLPYFKAGGRVLYCVEDVVEYIHREGARNVALPPPPSELPRDPYCLE